MAEYIERSGPWYDPAAWECVADVCKAIKNAPAADVVPTVRCSRREDKRARQIFIRVYGTEQGPREMPVLVVRLKEGDQDHAYQQTLRRKTPQEIAEAIERAAQILLDEHKDVAPMVHGRWVRPHWRNDVHCMDCSKCGKEAQHGLYRGVEKYYYLCPNCGAKMDLEEVSG